MSTLPTLCITRKLDWGNKKSEQHNDFHDFPKLSRGLLISNKNLDNVLVCHKEGQ